MSTQSRLLRKIAPFIRNTKIQSTKSCGGFFELTLQVGCYPKKRIMDMIMPTISMTPKYLYLGSTRIEIDQQEEYEDEQEGVRKSQIMN
jgi:hypothetical protein